MNLVEAHVLAAIRRHHGVPLEAARRAIRYLEAESDVPHPLANLDLFACGRNLLHEFASPWGGLVNVSAGGQFALDLIRPYLHRIQRDELGLARRLFPVRWSAVASPLTVVIDPCVSFGRPVIDGTRVPTAIIAELVRAGEKPEDLATEYALRTETIRQALEWEEKAKAA